jgi:hypothetical protein
VIAGVKHDAVRWRGYMEWMICGWCRDLDGWLVSEHLLWVQVVCVCVCVVVVVVVVGGGTLEWSRQVKSLAPLRLPHDCNWLPCRPRCCPRHFLPSPVDIMAGI